MVTGVVPSPPPVLAFIIVIEHSVQQFQCSSIFHRVLLTRALALSASQFVRKKKSQRIYTSMHSAGLELTKLTYTRLEDSLIRHRGDRPPYYNATIGGGGGVPFGAFFVIGSGSLARVTAPFYAVIGFRAGLIFRCESSKGWFSYAVPNESPNSFLSVSHRVTRASGSDRVVKIGGGVTPTVALIKTKMTTLNPCTFFPKKGFQLQRR